MLLEQEGFKNSLDDDNTFFKSDLLNAAVKLLPWTKLHTIQHESQAEE